MNKPKKKTQNGPVVARLVELKSRACQALAGDSNDAEHDALYEVEEALVSLTPDVRRMVQALKLCLKFLQVREIEPTRKGHPYLLWATAVSSGRLALGQRLRKGQDGMSRWRQIQRSSRNTTEGSRKPKQISA